MFFRGPGAGIAVTCVFFRGPGAGIAVTCVFFRGPGAGIAVFFLFFIFIFIFNIYSIFKPSELGELHQGERRCWNSSNLIFHAQSTRTVILG